MHNKRKGSLMADAIIIAAAAMMYLLLISPFNLIRAAAVTSASVYKTSSSGRASLVIGSSWNSSYLEEIIIMADKEGIEITVAVSRSELENEPKLISSLSQTEHEIAILSDEENSDEEYVKSCYKSLERITGKKPEFIITSSCPSQKLLRIARGLGLRVIVATTDMDTTRGSSAQIAERAYSAFDEGAFVFAEPTAELLKAFPDLIEIIKNMGMDIVSIHKMLYN